MSGSQRQIEKHTLVVAQQLARRVVAGERRVCRCSTMRLVPTAHVRHLAQRSPRQLLRERPIDCAANIGTRTRGVCLIQHEHSPSQRTVMSRIDSRPQRWYALAPLATILLRCLYSAPTTRCGERDGGSVVIERTSSHSVASSRPVSNFHSPP